MNAEQAYFLIEGGETTGPFTTAALRQQMQAGTLSPDTQCAPEGGEAWEPVGNLLQTTTPPPLPATTVGSFLVRPLSPELAGLAVIAVVAVFIALLVPAVLSASLTFRDMAPLGIVYLLASFGGFTGFLARQKGYSFGVWFFLGLLFGPIALVAAAGLPKNT